MTKEQRYELMLINAAERFEEIAKDVARLGDKHISEYTANTIAHKADLARHLILKALRKYNTDN